MGDTKVCKADSDLLSLIHQLVARQIIDKLKSDEVTPQDLAQAIKFLKDNDVKAELEHSVVLQEIEHEVVGELPFAVEEDEDAD
jgi:hypothetical protein